MPGWNGHLLLVLASSTGGIGAHVAGIVKGISAAGGRVTVCVPAATERLFRFTELGAAFVAMEIPATPHPSDMRAVRVMRAVLARESPDVLHAHGLRAGLAATLARPACPTVVTWHNAPLRAGMGGRVHVLVERIVGRGVTVTLCASSDLVARAHAVGARDVRLAAVAAPPLRPGRRSRAALRTALDVGETAPMLLSVGRLHPQKDYRTLISAAAGWRDLDPMPQVCIAGEGPSYLDLAGQISELRAPVTLLGHRTDVADLLGAADLAVVTSRWEARQLFAQEALQAGVPLVATEVGGIPELVGDAALLIPPSDVAALDKAVRRLLADPQALAELAARGRAQAATWPDEQAVVASLRELYQELTTGAGDAG